MSEKVREGGRKGGRRWSKEAWEEDLRRGGGKGMSEGNDGFNLSLGCCRRDAI